MAWYDEALCAWPERHGLDPEAWFPPSRAGRAELAGVLEVCHVCPVQEPCLDYALDQRIPAGIWGGLTEQQRDRLRRNRKAS